MIWQHRINLARYSLSYFAHLHVTASSVESITPTKHIATSSQHCKGWICWEDLANNSGNHGSCSKFSCPPKKIARIQMSGSVLRNILINTQNIWYDIYIYICEYLLHMIISIDKCQMWHSQNIRHVKNLDDSIEPFFCCATRMRCSPCDYLNLWIFLASFWHLFVQNVDVYISYMNVYDMYVNGLEVPQR